MEARSLAVRRLALVLIVLGCTLPPFAAQAQSSPSPGALARIALFEPSGRSTDATLTAALGTVADSVELSLVCLQRYEVRRLPAVDPTRELDKVRAYCQANRMDQAIMGSGSARSDGGYSFRLVLYDRKADSITLMREGACSGALDMFDTTDALVAALLDGLSGEHLLFGSLVVDTDPPGAAISVNGKEVGLSPLSLRGVPAGAVTVSARSTGREDAQGTVTILDGEMANASLSLARSMGALTLDVPEDAAVSIRGMAEKPLQGAGPQRLPTGRYEVSASCPGLDAASQTIEIQRNATFQWRPWPKGYLHVQSVPLAATVIIDGTERGITPLIVELDPGVLHRVELRKEKYEPYFAEVTAAAARKSVYRPVLTGKPGSVSVDTIPSGATAHLDKDRVLITPGTFEDVLPGAHALTFEEFFSNRRYYSSPEAVTVNVSPGEQSDLSHQLALVPATLSITDAPPDAAVTVDGTAVDRSRVFAAGADIPAGTLDIVVSTPAGQRWEKGYTSHPGVASTLSVKLMTAMLLRKTIRLDGALDDWEGISPCWQAQSPKLNYPNQPGTQLTRTYVCRDEQYIYWRMDFANGTPSTELSKFIDHRLVYAMRMFMGVESITAELMFDRSLKTATWVGVINSYTNTTTTLPGGLKWAIGSSTLELALPVSSVQRYFANGPLSVDFDVATVSPSGAWITTLASDGVYVDFR